MTKFVKGKVLDHEGTAKESCWSDIVCTRPCLNRLHQRLGVNTLWDERKSFPNKASHGSSRVSQQACSRDSQTRQHMDTWSRLSQLESPKQDNAWSIQGLLSSLFQGQTRQYMDTGSPNYVDCSKQGNARSIQGLPTRLFQGLQPTMLRFPGDTSPLLPLFIPSFASHQSSGTNPQQQIHTVVFLLSVTEFPNTKNQKKMKDDQI